MEAPVKKRLILSAAAVIIVLLLIYGFWPQPVSVDTARVERGPMNVTIEEEGMTRVKDRYVISAPVAGYARRITQEVGDTVATGQVLLQLDPMPSDVLDPRRHAEARARLSAAQAKLKAAQEAANAAAADAEYAISELNRIQGLFDSGASTRQTLDQVTREANRSRAHKASADFSVQVARYEVEAARSVLEYSAAGTNRREKDQVKILAPVDGSILKKYRESEGVVTAGQSLVEIGDPRSLEVQVEVLSSDAIQIRPGTPVRFRRWGGSDSLAGSVRVVEPTGFTKISALGVEEQRVWVIIDITSPIEMWNRLGDGYRMVADFIIWQSDDELQVPSSALFRQSKNWAAFRVDGNRAQLTRVQIGKQSGLQTVISSGLKQGDRVVIHPPETLEDGMRIDYEE